MLTSNPSGNEEELQFRNDVMAVASNKMEKLPKPQDSDEEQWQDTLREALAAHNMAATAAASSDLRGQANAGLATAPPFALPTIDDDSCEFDEELPSDNDIPVALQTLAPVAAAPQKARKPGTFPKIPPGEKSPKMLEVEAHSSMYPQELSRTTTMRCTSTDPLG